MAESPCSSSADTAATSTPADGLTDGSDDEVTHQLESLFQRAMTVLRPHVADDASAQQALEATQSEAIQHASVWADKALMWLACAHELDLEQKAMGEAMQLSLSEAEAQKAQQIPPHQLDTEELKSRYSGSRILNQLRNHEPTLTSGLWDDPQRQHLAQLLELELKACKWYPSSGTYTYMNQLGKQIATSMQSTARHQDAACSVSDGIPTKTVDLLQTQVQHLETVLYAMPETSGAAPKQFIELDNSAEDLCVTEVPTDKRQVECVELL